MADVRVVSPRQGERVGPRQWHTRGGETLSAPGKGGVVNKTIEDGVRGRCGGGIARRRAVGSFLNEGLWGGEAGHIPRTAELAEGHNFAGFYVAKRYARTRRQRRTVEAWRSQEQGHDCANPSQGLGRGRASSAGRAPRPGCGDKRRATDSGRGRSARGGSPSGHQRQASQRDPSPTRGGRYVMKAQVGVQLCSATPVTGDGFGARIARGTCEEKRWVAPTHVGTAGLGRASARKAATCQEGARRDAPDGCWPPAIDDGHGRSDGVGRSRPAQPDRCEHFIRSGPAPTERRHEAGRPAIACVARAS